MEIFYISFRFLYYTYMYIERGLRDCRRSCLIACCVHYRLGKWQESPPAFFLSLYISASLFYPLNRREAECLYIEGKKKNGTDLWTFESCTKKWRGCVIQKEKELTLGYTQYSFDDGIWALFYSLLKNQMFMYSIV